MEDKDTLRSVVKLLKDSSSQKLLNISPRLKVKAHKKTRHESMTQTIFDINKDDRYRILKLIEQLIDTQDSVDQLKQKLDDERAEFREKRAKLIKKLDRLSENHGKALSDINLLKEKYSANLKLLEEKISTVSDQLEASVTENKKLREVNENLLNENVALRNINSDATSIISSFHEEKSRISVQLEAHKQKEKVYKKQLKKVISEIKNDTRLEEMSPLRQRNSSYEINLVKQESAKGSGDFVKDKNLISSELESITAPAIVIFDKSKTPSLHSATSNVKSLFNAPSSSDLTKRSTLNFKNDFDAAILEDLFFRF